MFAGPNGSGKSTLKELLDPKLLGVYLNPDEIEATVQRSGILDFRAFGIEHETAEAAKIHFLNSALLKNAGLTNNAKNLSFFEHHIAFSGVEMNSYFASVAVDYLRGELLKHRLSFTFETVMSHPGKVAILEEAQSKGYRTYLYYVATEDPEINLSRVRNRVRLGGHDVPEGKIIERYKRSLQNLREAIRASHRAYIFDNSSHNTAKRHTWIAEITDGHRVEIKTDQIPAWFHRAVLQA